MRGGFTWKVVLRYCERRLQVKVPFPAVATLRSPSALSSTTSAVFRYRGICAESATGLGSSFTLYCRIIRMRRRDLRMMYRMYKSTAAGKGGGSNGTTDAESRPTLTWSKCSRYPRPYGYCDGVLFLRFAADGVSLEVKFGCIRGFRRRASISS